VPIGSSPLVGRGDVSVSCLAPFVNTAVERTAVVCGLAARLVFTIACSCRQAHCLLPVDRWRPVRLGQGILKIRSCAGPSNPRGCVSVAVYDGRSDRALVSRSLTLGVTVGQGIGLRRICPREIRAAPSWLAWQALARFTLDSLQYVGPSDPRLVPITGLHKSVRTGA